MIGRTVEWADRGADGKPDGLKDRRKDGWKDGRRTDGRMNKRTDGRTARMEPFGGVCCFEHGDGFIEDGES